MCTLVVAASVVPGFPLVVIANRDEELDRPAVGPRVWPQGFVAPRDEVAGGTWLGYTESGIFAGITNRFLGPRDGSRRSRGELTVEALSAGSLEAAHTSLGRLRPEHYNGFHLVYTDGYRVFATISDGVQLAQLELGLGLTIVTERSFGAADVRPRVARIEAKWAQLLAAGFSPERATTLLADHDENDPLAATCIHIDALRYGTRSAMVLARGAGEKRPVMLWAEGPPCTTPFSPVSPMEKTG